MLSSIELKTPDQIRAMRAAGEVVARGLRAMCEAVRPGITTAEIDQIGRRVIEQAGATSNFFNYGAEWGMTPFPAVSCISVNEMVVHGIPNDRVVNEGDLVSIDYGAIVNGWHGDAARTCRIGSVDQIHARLDEVTKEALWKGIEAAWHGKRIGDISAAIEMTARSSGLKVGICKDFTGHGIGTQMHMEPDVPNYVSRRKGPKLKSGMVIAIEPIFTVGTDQTIDLDDEWSVVTADSSWAAHWENTVAICDDGLWVLTEEDGGYAELQARGIPLASIARA